MFSIKDFQLYLFDFDGLLVNTEILHFEAYRMMCKQRGFYLDWDLPRYFSAAHHCAEGLQQQIYAQFPQLKELEPDWNVLYQEKKACLMELIENGTVDLMPGVEPLLKKLEEMQIKRCVVTNSSAPLIHAIRKKVPILNSIPFWITRESYNKPKPDPECYHKAIELHAAPEDTIIGFEDSPRGFKALAQTCAKPILVSEFTHSELQLPYIQFKTLDAVFL